MPDSNSSSELKLEENSLTKVVEDTVPVVEDTVPVTKNDVKLILNILQIINQRGGFVLDEYQIVGELNKKLKELYA